MASTDARPVPRKNVAYRVTFPILDADGDLVTAAAALDSEVSKDGGTFADCTNEATEIATSSGIYYLDLTATEMNADTVAIIVKTTTTGAKTTSLVMYPEEIGDYRADVQQWLGGTVNALISGRVDANAQVVGDKTGYSVGTGGIVAGSFAANAIDAAAIAASGVEKILRSVSGTADSTTTTTVTDAERTEADTDYWKDAIIVFTAGPAIHQPRRISAFNPATDVITVDTAFTTSPGANTYIILRTAMMQAAGGGASDWTSGEREQIRHRLGIDGTASAPSATPSLASASALSTVQSDTDDIQTRLPAALVSGRMDASVGAYQSGLTPLQPTVAGRTLDVTATGEAGIDLDNTVGTLAKGTDITGFNDLSAAQVNAEVDAALDTAIPGLPTANSINERIKTMDDADIPGRLPAVLVSGRMDSSVGAYQSGLTPLQPTVAGRTLDVTTTGEAGIDLDNTVGALAKGTEITGFNDPSAASIASTVWAEVMEGTTTAIQMMRGFASAMMGKSSQHESGTPKYRDLADTKNRLDATTDANGNRTSVTRDLT